jgi:uncharacterized protein with gpF-like domain
MIDEMERSTLHWLSAAWRGNPPPLMAMDELSSRALQQAVRDLVRRWNRRFTRAAAELAQYFAKSVNQRTDAALKKILKDGGLSVEFSMSQAQRDVLGAVVHQNVSLIKSIPQQSLAAVEGHVMQSVSMGRDLATLTKVLKTQFNVTRRRAKLIALDQNNKATAALTRARYLETGIQEAVWVHSGAGKEPRSSHVKAGRERARFNVAEGWWDPDEKKHVLPGELINCRCSMRPIIKGILA